MRVGLTIAALVLSMLFIVGCKPNKADASQASEDRPLSFTIVNNSRGEIHSIGLAGSNHPMSFRPIDKGSSSTIKSKKLQLPETLSLHWSDHRGDRHEGSVRVWSELGASYSGPVRLTIDIRNKVTLTGD